MQSPEKFLANMIPPSVRNDPRHKDTITTNLTALKKVTFLTDSQQIAAMYQRGLSDDARAATADKIDGVQKLCTVFQALGVETKNKNLANGAQLISAGTQLHSAYLGFTAATAATTAATATGAAAASSALSATALINPVATAALAVFSIYSTLKRKKVDNSFADAMMNVLGIINTNVQNGFKKSFGYHEMTIELINDGFKTLNESQHAMFKQNANTQMYISIMHSDISNELKKLTWYVQALGGTLTDGQELIALQPFSDLLSSADDILLGRTTENMSEQIQQTANALKQWAIHPHGKASNPIHTGVKFFAYTPRQPSELYAIINHVMNHINPYSIMGWQGMLAHIVKNQLKSEAAKNVDVKELFNPELWLEATKNYLLLRQACPGLVRDPDNHIVNAIIAAADNQIAWELEKRHSIPLYNTVFELYEEGIQQIQKMLKDLMFQKVQERHSDISLPLDQLLKQYVDLMCVNPNCVGENSVTYFVPYTLTQVGYSDADFISMGLDPTDTRRRVNEHHGYAQQIKKGTDTTYPIPIHHHVFALAERLGLIAITAHQQIKYRKPTESAGSGPTGNGPSSYISDDTYTLKATINGSERIIQLDEFTTNHQTNTKIFVQKPTVPDIEDSLIRVRGMIMAEIEREKKAVIMKLLTDPQSRITLKDEALASIDASIRLLSALMDDWPVSIRQNTHVSVNDSSKIMEHLENRNNLTWQQLIEGVQNPQYAATKHHNLYVITVSEDSNFNDGYLTDIREQHRIACEIRDNPPVVPAVEPVPPAAEQLVAALIQTVKQQTAQIDEQSRQVTELTRQNAVLSAQMNQLQQMFAFSLQMQQSNNGAARSGSSRATVLQSPARSSNASSTQSGRTSPTNATTPH
ncbi:MAG: hypothetical protein ACHQAX_01410 [Gammaproteobacteria bacterium]